MKRYILLFATVFFALNIAAQAKLEFEKTVHDFGTFNEADAFVNCTFKFKNAGDAPLIITKAKASCGCTVPEYSKAPIAPGQEGEIKVTYSAIGRPGSFSKAVIISTNASPLETQLIIKGKVVGDVDRDEYRYYINGLKLKTVDANIGDVFKGQSKSISLDTWNGSDKNIDIEVNNIPAHISVIVEPKILKPAQKGKMTITCNTALTNEWGQQADEFSLSVKKINSINGKKQIKVLANIVEDFSKQKGKSPKVELSAPLLNLGEVIGKQGVQKEVSMSNKGKGNLILRKISSSSDAVTATAKTEEIKSGESTQITISINPAKCKSRIVNETVTIITNDAEKPELKIQVTATLK